MNNNEKIIQLLESMQSDVSAIKSDIENLKNDQISMQSDVKDLKKGQTEIKTELRGIWDDILRLDKRLTAQDEELVIMRRLK